MDINSEFGDTLRSFEIFKDCLHKLSFRELHKLSHQYNDTIKILSAKISEQSLVLPLTTDERMLNMVRLEKLSEITLQFAIEINRRISTMSAA